MKQFKLTSALAVIVLVGCAASPGSSNANPSGGGSSSERVPGIIDYYGEPVCVTIPAEAREPFAVAVMTYGGGCTKKGEATVRVEALRAVVKPYDHDTPAPQLDCDNMLRVYEYTVTDAVGEPLITPKTGEPGIPNATKDCIAAQEPVRPFLDVVEGGLTCGAKTAKDPGQARFYPWSLNRIRHFLAVVGLRAKNPSQNLAKRLIMRRIMAIKMKALEVSGRRSKSRARRRLRMNQANVRSTSTVPEITSSG